MAERDKPVADVVGYSRLAGADEDRILARLRALRSDLIDPTITYERRGEDIAHRGLYLDVPPWTAHVFDVTAV